MTYDELLNKEKEKKTRKKKDDEEHRIQSSCIKWYRLQYPKLWHNLFSVPNGGRRDSVTGRRLKAEGVLAGVADLILLKSNRFYGALLIEMKTKKGIQSEEQEMWENKITRDGYKYVVCRSLDDFIREVTNYLNDV